MKKDEFLNHSVQWLTKIQNEDGGWGMYDYDPSRIVTTAEAVTALTIAGVQGNVIEKGINYLISSGNNPKWCQYIRHHAWIVYALTKAGRKKDIPDRCLQSLTKNHMRGAWGHAPKEEPNIFATLLSYRALNLYGKPKNIIEQSYSWISSHNQGAYWTFGDNTPSFSATSYAILVLASSPNSNNKYKSQIDNAVDFLLSGAKDNWPNEYEKNVSGDLLYNFHHFTLPWVIMALLTAGVSPFEPKIVSAMDCLYNGHYWKLTGGWAEEINHRPSIFGTSHALAAMEVFYDSLTIASYLDENKTYSTRKDADIIKNKKDVFIVHGHDTAMKQTMARFLEKIGCNPIILDEQINTGLNTIFEKIMDKAKQVSYAIVLLSPDDIVQNADGENKKRARQNVILELGLFIGQIGAENVCLARKGNVEIPSDISGVLYVSMDDDGWKLALAQKLKHANFDIDIQSLPS
jgi:predicted nucleotide-binding protein